MVMVVDIILVVEIQDQQVTHPLQKDVFCQTPKQSLLTPQTASSCVTKLHFHPKIVNISVSEPIMENSLFTTVSKRGVLYGCSGVADMIKARL